MLAIESYPVALVLTAISLICWGSWGNTQKGSQQPPLQYYLDFTVGLWISSVLLVLLLGTDAVPCPSPSTSGCEGRSIFNDVTDAGRAKDIPLAFAAGVVFNFANLGLVLAISRVGLSVAMPLVVGTAMVLGTTLNFIIDPSPVPGLIFPGIALGFCAVCAMAVAYKLKEDAKRVEAASAAAPFITRDALDAAPIVAATGSASESESERAAYSSFASRGSSNGGDVEAAAAAARGRSDSSSSMSDAERAFAQSPMAGILFSLALCLVSGILMGLWSPMATSAMTLLTPYTVHFWFTTAVLMTSLPITSIVGTSGIMGKRSNVCTYFNCRGKSLREVLDHLWGFAGGFIWTVGTLFNFVAGPTAGFAVSYAIGQSAPLCAAAWGVLVWREFVGAPVLSWLFLWIMLVLYGGGIALIALSGRVD